MADRLMGTSLHFLGEQVPARRHIESMLTRYAMVARGTHAVPASSSTSSVIGPHYFQARILWLLGQTDSALRDLEENVADTLALDHTMSLCNVLAQSACPIAILAGDLDAAARYVDLLHHTEAQALNIFYTYAVCFEAELIMSARRRRSRPCAGSSRRWRSCREAASATISCPSCATRAGALMQLGRFDEAEQAVDEALGLCQRTGARSNLPELHPAPGGDRAPPSRRTRRRRGLPAGARAGAGAEGAGLGAARRHQPGRGPAPGSRRPQGAGRRAGAVHGGPGPAGNQECV